MTAPHDAPPDGASSGPPVRLLRSAHPAPAVPHAHAATTSRADLTVAWEVVARALGDHDAPSTLVGVSVLGWPDQLVEVEAVAVLPPTRAS